MLDLVTPLVRRWRLILLVPLLFAISAGAISFLMPAEYTATTTFSQESEAGSVLSGGLAGLAGLAGQFGLMSVPGGGITPDYLASVLESRELCESALTSKFVDPSDGHTSRTLLSLMHVEGETQRERMSNGVQLLTDLVEPSVDRKTGIISLRVRLHDPVLAAAVANRMVQFLDRFNVEQRKTQSRQQREFISDRLAQAEQELHQAEQEEIRFLQTNRQYTDSPLLKFEANRLERRVQVKQEVFLTLTKAYEDARIAEVRDTPSITVIDTAVAPVLRSSPHRKLMVLLGLIVGVFVSIAIAYLLDLRQRARRGDRSDQRAFMEAWAQARDEFATTIGRLKK